MKLEFAPEKSTAWGRNYSNKNPHDNTGLTMGNKEIPSPPPRVDPIYLGTEIVDKGTSNSASKRMVNKAYEKLNRISNKTFRTSAENISRVITATIAPSATWINNSLVTKQSSWEKVAKRIRGTFRKKINIMWDVPRELLYLPRSEGGWGLVDINTEIEGTFIDRYIDCLNSPDKLTRESTRSTFKRMANRTLLWFSNPPKFDKLDDKNKLIVLLNKYNMILDNNTYDIQRAKENRFTALKTWPRYPQNPVKQYKTPPYARLRNGFVRMVWEPMTLLSNH
jgi:hypothetical protein